MIAFLTILYALLIWLIFFYFKLWPFTFAAKVASAVVGVVAIFGILIAVNFLHPQSLDARVYQHVIEVASRTSQPARVTEVRVQPNVPVKQGDVLFILDPRPYQLEVARLEAALQEAEQTVPQLKAALEGASASVQAAQSQLQLAKSEFERNKQLRANSAVSQEDFEKTQRSAEVADQNLAISRSAETQAHIAIDVGQAKTAETRAALGKARLDLEETTVKAPADGYATNLVLRPGFVVRPGDPVVTFVCDPEGIVVVTMPQEYLGTIEVGNEVEVCLDSLPGKTLAGKVEAIILASGEGQTIPTGELPTVTTTAKAARFPIKVRLDPAELGRHRIPAGAHGAAAVYTNYGQSFRMVRKVVLRWYTWLNYLKISM